jgi:glycosyltransferase involved in cell wall biosynthesis
MGPRHRFLGLGLVRLAQARASVPRYVEQMRLLAPDVVVTNSSVIPAPAWAARRASIPHVWIVRESFLTNRQLRSVLPARVLGRTIVKSSAAVLTVSEFVHQQLAQAVQAPGLHVWPIRPTPCPTSGRSSPRRDKERDRLRLVLAGHISREKGHFLALRALRRLRRGNCTVTLDVVGTGRPSTVMALRALIPLYGLARAVHLHGWRDDMSDAYADADALLMVSRNEAFGRTTVEAIFAGVPVLGLDAGGTSELLRDGGGELVRPVTARALSEAMARWAALGPEEWKACLASVRARARQLEDRPSQFSYLARALTHALAGGPRSGDSA